jgi:PAS domain S-box-containing protein
MNLDVRTMYMAMAATCFIVAGALLIFQTGRFQRDGTLQWALGWASQGVFWTLLGLRGVIWDFFSIVVAHTFLAASFSLLYAAVRQFQDHPHHRGFLLLPPAATFLFFWYFSEYVDNVSARIMFISFLSIVQISVIVRALFRDTPVQEKRSSWLTGSAFVVMAVIWVNRLLEAFTLPYGNLSALKATAFRNASVTAWLGVVIFSSIGFVLMIRERANEALRESEEKYRNLVKFAPAAIYEMNLEGTKFLSVNEVLCDILKYSREELLAIKPADLLDYESRSLFKERITKKLAGEKIDETVEYRIRRKDGELIDTIVNVGAFRYTNDKPSRVVVIAYDITERKRIEEALRQSEERYRHLVQHAPAGIYEIDFTTGHFTEVNDVMCLVLGYTRDEFFAMTAFDILDDEGRDRFASRIRLGRSGERPDEAAEFRVRTKDGRLIWALVNVKFRWSGDKIVGATVVAHDITDRKRAEEELRKSRDGLEMRVQERTSELEKANEALRHLSSRLLSAQEQERKRIAGEIHDTLGSCLSGVKYKIEDVLHQIGKGSNFTEESLRSVIPMVQEGIEECRRLQMDLRPPMLDDLGLLPTLSWFCRRYETIYSGIKVELEETLEEKDIPNALKILIFRVTQEGMNNIAKHSKTDLVRLSLRKMDGRIELVLEDNGQGFDLKKVLGSESTRRGLGLTSMRERTELSGGSFAIESVERKGTTIRASWPSGRKDATSIKNEVK